MIENHTLLADWFFLLAWVVALIYCVVLVMEWPVKHSAVLLPLTVGLVAAGLWVL